MYFNLKSLPDSTTEVRPKSFYLEKGAVVLGLDAPMIIYCDDTCVEDIRALRGSRPTEYIIKPFTEYDFYTDLCPIVTRQREANYIDNRNTPSYCVLTMFKIYMIYKSSLTNPFRSTHFAWVDFGGSHIMRNLAPAVSEIVKNPHPKVAMCYIHYRSRDELRDNSAFHNGGLCGVAATSYTVEATYATRFYTGCMSIFYELLSKGKGHVDEQVMTYYYDRYPEHCTLCYGDYYSIVSNYAGVKEDYPSIKRFFIQEALNKGRKDLAAACARKVLASPIELPEDERRFLQSLV